MKRYEITFFCPIQKKKKVWNSLILNLCIKPLLPESVLCNKVVAKRSQPL